MPRCLHSKLGYAERNSLATMEGGSAFLEDEVEDHPGSVELEEAEMDDAGTPNDPDEETCVLAECEIDEQCHPCGTDSLPDAGYLPSKVTDKDYIYLPRSMENFEEREEWRRSGKWLLFSHGSLDTLDDLWARLRPLVADGTLACVKCSTATDPVQGVAMCYTSDCGDARAVKRAADAIRGVAPTDYLLYYKTNEASNRGLYRMHGDAHITKYMHSAACSLYQRDGNNWWQKMIVE